MANIWIENHGVFSVSNEKVQELLQWVQTNGGVKSEASTDQFDGKTLLNESPAPQHGANVGNAKPKSETDPGKGGDYDFGGTWM